MNDGTIKRTNIGGEIKMLHMVRYYVQNKFPKLYLYVYRMFVKIRKIRSIEKQVQYGNLNADKFIYVIRIRKETLGLMGYYMAILGHIKIAIDRKCVPVVDMQNYKNTYLKECEVGEKNSWEYYFCQPSKVTLIEAYKSQNVILSNMETPIEAEPRRFYYEVYLKQDMKKYYTIVSEMMNLNSSTQKKVDDVYDCIMKSKKELGNRIIGVVSRGTDLLGFPGHSKQPTTNELIEATEKLMKEYSCQYVFLASDTDQAIREFCDYFGKEYVLTNQCKRYDECGTNVLSNIHFERENDEYLKGMEYLTTMWLLSKTDVLFGSLVGSTVGAICMNKGRYDHVEIYDEGMY